MRLRRQPRPELRPLVKELWYSDEPACDVADREHSLPTADMHLVLRLSGGPLRLFRDTDDRAGSAVGHDIIGGPRAVYYVKEISRPACTVGAVLAHGASFALFGAPACELAGRHTRLDDLWGATAESARSQVLDARTPTGMLSVFESLLAQRLPRVRGLHPAVAMALARFQEGAAVNQVVAESGYSHRRFLQVFRETAGLAPKEYCRVRRFQTVLSRMAEAIPMVELAVDCGFSDQAHFNREFLLFAGVTPGEYRRIAPGSPSHLPVPGQFSSRP